MCTVRSVRRIFIHGLVYTPIEVLEKKVFQ